MSRPRSFLRRRRRCARPRVPALVLAVLGVAAPIAVVAGPAAAHAPHDQVTDVEPRADYAESGVVFAVVRGHLMRSDDRGDTWHEIVRGLGGESSKISTLSLSPSDPMIGYAVEDSGRVLRSGDGGEQWSPTADPGFAARVARVSPTDPSVVVAVGGGFGFDGRVARSGDGGATWDAVEVDGAPLTAWDIAWYHDGASLIGFDTGGRVLRSDDGATSWTRGDVYGGDLVRAIAVGPGGLGDATVLVGADDGLWRTSGTGTWERLGTAAGGERIDDLAFSPTFAADATIWAVAFRSGTLVSRDGGDSWTLVDEGLTTTPQAVATGGSDFRAIALAPDGSGRRFLAAFTGVFVAEADDPGWTPVETLADYLTGLAVAPRDGDGRTLVVFTYVKGALVSDDDGATWRLADAGLEVPEVSEGNEFAPVYRLHNVATSPDYPTDGTVFGATWTRVVRSQDRGSTWESIRVGTAPEGSPLRQYVLALSPGFADDDTLWTGTRQGEVFVSHERGDPGSWERLATLPARVRSLGPTAESAAGGTMFAGTVDGLYRSLDGGVTWSPSGVLNQAEVTGRETDFGIQVAVSPAFAADGTAFASTDHGLVVTRDGGDSWQEITGSSAPRGHVEAVALSPEFATDGLVLASSGDQGLVRSLDGGVTFEPVGADLIEENLLISDYANPTSRPIVFSPDYGDDHAIYAVAQTSLIRSVDGGVSWERLDLPSGLEVRAALTGEPAPDTTQATTTSAPPEPTAPAPTASTTPDAPDDGGEGADSSAALTVLVVLGVVGAAGAVGGAGLWRRRRRD